MLPWYTQEIMDALVTRYAIKKHSSYRHLTDRSRRRVSLRSEVSGLFDT